MSDAETIDAVFAIIAETRSWYDESIFPPIARGENAPFRPPDAYAAAGARIACDNIRVAVQSLLDDGIIVLPEGDKK